MVRTPFTAVLMFLLFPALVQAQAPDYSMQLGEFQKINHLPKGVQIEDVESNGIYVVKSDRKGRQGIDVPWVIERYDKQTFQKTDSIFLNIKEGTRRGRIEKVLTLKNEVYVFYSVKENQNITLFARQIDKYLFQLDNRSIRILEIAKPKKHRIQPGIFEFALSPNGSKIFVVRDFATDSTHHTLSSFAMLDNELNVLWQKVVTLPVFEGDRKLKALKVNDAGQGFLLASRKLAYELNSGFDLLITSRTGESVLRYKLQADNGYLSSLAIEVDGTQNLLCAGLYTKAGGPAARGTYFANISLTNPSLPAAVVSDFDMLFALEEPHKSDVRALQASAELNGEPELSQYILDRIYKEEDGSMLLIAEQRYEYSTTPASSLPLRYNLRTGVASRTLPSSQQQPSRNYRGDILIVKLDSGGHKLWEKRIHKSQDTDNAHRIFTSYFLLNFRGKLGLLFNEDKRNVVSHPTSRSKDFAGRRSILTLASISSGGEVSREWLFESANSDVAVSPAMCSQVSDQELILYGYHGTRQQFSRINFK